MAPRKQSTRLNACRFKPWGNPRPKRQRQALIVQGKSQRSETWEKPLQTIKPSKVSLEHLGTEENGKNHPASHLNILRRDWEDDHGTSAGNGSTVSRIPNSFNQTLAMSHQIHPQSQEAKEASLTMEGFNQGKPTRLADPSPIATPPGGNHRDRRDGIGTLP